MSHMLDMTTGTAAIAYVGETPWHNLGARLEEGASIADWARAARLDWRAEATPAFTLLPPEIEPEHSKRMIPVEGQQHLIRSDTRKALGYFTTGYKAVQPIEVLEFFQDYVCQDDRFRLEVAGALRGGSQIWALARYQGDDLIAAGDRHSAYCLLATSYDGSMATTAQATMIRVVCNNTLTASMRDKRAAVKVRHNTKFEGARVSRELSAVAEQFDAYKSMADALATQRMAKEDVSAFFKTMLDIPFDASASDISTRKINQFNDLNRAYVKTVADEGAPEAKPRRQSKTRNAPKTRDAPLIGQGRVAAPERPRLC